ncbi:MAG: 16S rRNA (guanine(966)-N(2))-methyltransferase RsmD [Chloroflexota bacterium]|nr:16S rRNA (guanine(966)-N(2))-methyltransferase RsmD [Chloroflexota bacterium]
MRVIAGRCAGTRLASPHGGDTRPLTDRVKESLFGALEPRLSGANVLDLYAGSGAAGIEALSRGAARAVFVERSRTAAEAIAANLARTGLVSEARVVVGEVERFLAGEPDEGYHVAILDPPYDTAVDEATLRRLAAWLTGDGVAVVKHFWRTSPESERFEALRTRRFGETTLTFLQPLATEGR